MSTQEALEVFDCMANLDVDTLEVYMHSHPERIREAAKLGADAMGEIQKLHKLLECWDSPINGIIGKIWQEIEDCEYIQNTNESDYTKEQAMIIAYENIKEIIYGREQKE